MSVPEKRTKIVCTIGPASNTPDTLERLVQAGMNVARFNFSHGTYDEHAAMIATLRSVAEKTGQPIAIIQDLQGPKVRVGVLPAEGVSLENGAEVVFTTDPVAGAPKIHVSHDGLHNDVKADDVILLDDGLIDVRVLRVEGRDIVCVVVHGGLLLSHKGFNLPTATLSIPVITDKDKEDVRFGVSQKVDFVALSFVRAASDIVALRELITGLDADTTAPVRIIAKIEKHEAIKNIDEIIDASDAIMVARGDLGIETPPEDVPIFQKRIIEKCRGAAKPVIVATQMLDSMIRNPRPTRAEVSDVANAVIDHTDAVMLSGETASGKFPIEAVEIMSRIVHETEASEFDDLGPNDLDWSRAGGNGQEALARAVQALMRNSGATLILITTASGDAARTVSRLRPTLPVYAATGERRVCEQLALSWGVIPLLFEGAAVSELAAMALVRLKERQIAKPGDKIIIAGGGHGLPHVEIVEVK